MLARVVFILTIDLIIILALYRVNMIQIYHIVNRLQNFLPSCHHYFFQHCMNEHTKDQRYNLPVDLFCIKTHNSAYFTFPSRRCAMCLLCLLCVPAAIHVFPLKHCLIFSLKIGAVSGQTVECCTSIISQYPECPTTVPPQSTLPVSSTESVSFCALPRHQQTEAVYL